MCASMTRMMVIIVVATLGLGGGAVLAQSGTRLVPPARSAPASPLAGSGERATSQAPVALEGYCPVSVLTMRQWVKGNPALRVVYDGRTYLFANEQGKRMFEADPAKYIPALGGDCVVALVTMGQRVKGDVHHSATYNGRLFLFSKVEGKQMFLADPARYANADLALGGNCAVCAAGGVQTPGRSDIAAYYRGLRYLFPSTELRDEFLAHPERYVAASASGIKPQ